jgi:DNA-binding response OmpR family regulator
VTIKCPRVLIVEDDAPLAHLYTTALTLRGIATSRASDGFAALKAIEERRPDLIVLDLAMPGIDGQTVLRELAAHVNTRDIPVIVVTGTDTRSLMPPAIMVLSKPCEPEHLARMVCDHLPLAATN